MVSEFRGKYYFLSNFFEVPVNFKSITYQNNEAAFQSMKCPERASEFSQLSPSDAKRKGRHIKLRNDWESVKFELMYEICKAKFEQNETLKEKLIATGATLLQEGNTWNDTEWGVCRGKGKNNLGKILMRVRDELKS